MKKLWHNRISLLITIVFSTTVLIMVFNTIFFRSLFQLNRFNADDANGNVISYLIYSFHGYEMLITGTGEMSEYPPKEWTEKLTNLSSGWKISIKRVTVEEGVTSISSGAFSGCSELNSVNLPHSLMRIGVNAFAYCYALETINYNGTIEEWKYVIDNSPMWHNESFLTSVICSDGVYTISI